MESDGGRESELAPTTPPSQSSDLDDFERFKRELEMSMPIPSPGLSDTDRLNLEIESGIDVVRLYCGNGEGFQLVAWLF